MQSRLTIILAALTASAIVGMVTVNMQQVSAPRECGGCAVFKKLTHEFKKNVIEAATSDDPNTIPSLLEQYNQDVLDLFARGN